MGKITVYSIALALAGLLFITTLGMIGTGNLEHSGLLILGFFALLALGFSGYEKTKGLIFTTMIFAGVTAALYYPHYFTNIGDFKFTGKASLFLRYRPLVGFWVV